jgi:hypothetical protein
MADCLVQVFDELNGFHYRASHHDPKNKVYFQRDPHRASPLLYFEGLEATNAAQEMENTQSIRADLRLRAAAFVGSCKGRERC